MAIVRFFKLDEVPVIWVSDAIYFIKETDTVTGYVTDISGNPFKISDDALRALIESVDTNLALEIQDRVNADNALQDQINGSGNYIKTLPAGITVTILAAEHELANVSNVMALNSLNREVDVYKEILPDKTVIVETNLDFLNYKIIIS